jgi:anti-sigma factor ChrR (cupin superfamily)
MVPPDIVPTISLESRAFSIPELLARRGPPHWLPLHPGVEICPLYDHGPDGPAAAILRYAPGGAVPAHEHQGHEHIFVLEGEQQDHRGRYTTGTCVVNPPGSRHEVRSSEGCIVIVIWERPVRILP